MCDWPEGLLLETKCLSAPDSHVKPNNTQVMVSEGAFEAREVVLASQTPISSLIEGSSAFQVVPSETMASGTRTLQLTQPASPGVLDFQPTMEIRENGFLLILSHPVYVFIYSCPDRLI